jgi:mono/diheme cytochrome c family protein
MRTRLSLLVIVLGVAAVAVACGRASDDDVLSALGITPTATMSAEQMSTSTAVAVADQETRTAAMAEIEAGGASPVSLAAAGDVVQGKTQFQIRCLRCHQPTGTGAGPSLAGPGNAATLLSDQEIVDLVRTGEGHAAPPGPLNEVTISDRQMINILAYIRDQAE